MGRAQTRLQEATNNTINNLNRHNGKGNTTVNLGGNWSPDPWILGMQALHCLVSVAMFCMILLLHQQLADHNRNVESINRHTSLTVAAKSADEKSFFALALLRTDHGQRVAERKLATDDYLGAALYPSDSAGVHSVCVNNDLYRDAGR